VLVVTSTEKVRKAFQGDAGGRDVVSDFTPDVSIPLSNSPLRHVVFSADGDFLVISAEGQGGLAVFGANGLMRGNQKPEQEISTDGIAVRTLLPCPGADYTHCMAVVLDSGKLCLVDVAQAQSRAFPLDGVTCVVWSTKGKAFAAGLKDGTVAIYKMEGNHMGNIPRPPGVDEKWEGTSLPIRFYSLSLC
jgi:nucleoporin NUP159